MVDELRRTIAELAAAARIPADDRALHAHRQVASNCPIWTKPLRYR